MQNNENLNSMCDSVKYTLCVSDELTHEQKKHLDECVDCRTFYEQNKIMSEHLAGLRADFGKGELGVADAVMKEINSQKIFTFGTPFMNRRIFKHAGLVAACLIVVVMALPIMNANMGKGADGAAENQSTVIEDAVTDQSYDYAYNYKIADVSDKSMYNLYDIITTDGSEANGNIIYETADEETDVKMGAIYDVYDDSKDYAVPTERAEEETVNGAYEKEIMLDSDIVFAVTDIVSAHGLDISSAAFDYFSAENVQIRFTDDASEIIFIIDLELKNGKWTVISANALQSSEK